MSPQPYPLEGESSDKYGIFSDITLGECKAIISDLKKPAYILEAANYHVRFCNDLLLDFLEISNADDIVGKGILVLAGYFNALFPKDVSDVQASRQMALFKNCHVQPGGNIDFCVIVDTRKLPGHTNGDICIVEILARPHYETQGGTRRQTASIVTFVVNKVAREKETIVRWLSALDLVVNDDTIDLVVGELTEGESGGFAGRVDHDLTTRRSERQSTDDMEPEQHTSGVQESKSASKNDTTLAQPHLPPRWRNELGDYENQELIGLRFDTLDALHTAIDISVGPDLIGMPHMCPGRRSMIVPKESVPVFRRAGLKFTEEPVGEAD